MAEPYRDQVRLLLDILPLVMAEPVFALKGGTAINLFEWDLPRLSGRQLKVLARRFPMRPPPGARQRYPSSKGAWTSIAYDVTKMTAHAAASWNNMRKQQA